MGAFRGTQLRRFTILLRSAAAAQKCTVVLLRRMERGFAEKAVPFAGEHVRNHGGGVRNREGQGHDTQFLAEHFLDQCDVDYCKCKCSIVKTTGPQKALRTNKLLCWDVKPFKTQFVQSLSAMTLCAVG